MTVMAGIEQPVKAAEDPTLATFDGLCDLFTVAAKARGIYHVLVQEPIGVTDVDSLMDALTDRSLHIAKRDQFQITGVVGESLVSVVFTMDLPPSGGAR